MVLSSFGEHSPFIRYFAISAATRRKSSGKRLGSADEGAGVLKGSGASLA